MPKRIDKEDLGARIRQAIEMAGGVGTVQAKSGLPARSLHNYMSGINDPRFTTIALLAEVCDFSLDWLATARMPGLRGLALKSGLVMIPRYDIEASAGAGSLADAERVVGHFGMERSWIRRHFDADPEKLALLTAVGDSMEPTIRSGDLLLVDTELRDTVDGAIYILELEGHLAVKRVQHLAAGAGVVVKSDNTALYEPQRLSPKEAENLRVVGRVRWASRVL